MAADSNNSTLKEAICENLKIVLLGDERRQAAENQIEMFHTIEDYGLQLMEISLSEEIEFSVRHMASVLLDQYITKHWCAQEAGFVEPEIPAPLKPLLREYLLKSLAISSPTEELNHEIKRLIGMFAHSISKIVMFDWSESWPVVFPVLIQYLTQYVSPSGIHSSLAVFRELAHEVCDSQIPACAPPLLPTMLGIFSNPQFSIQHRSDAISIFGIISETVMYMNQYDGNSFKQYLEGFMQQFAEGVVQALTIPQGGGEILDFGFRKEVINTLNKFVSLAKESMAQYLPKIMEFIWQNLTVTAQSYAKNSLQTCDVSDSDLESDFNMFIYSIIDFVSNIFEWNKYRRLIKPVLGDLLYFIMFYVQITDEQAENWINDPQAFIEEDNIDADAYCVRIAACTLFRQMADEMCTTSPLARPKAVQEDAAFKRAFLDALTRHFQNATELQKSQPSGSWWKGIEACFCCLGLITDEVLCTLKNEKNEATPEFKRILEQLLVYPNNFQFPFLAARSIWTAAKFSPIMNEQSMNSFLSLTAKLLTLTDQPILRVMALRATYNFCVHHQESSSTQNLLKPYLSGFLEGLVSIGMGASDIILVDVLETINILLMVDPEFTSSVSNQISSLAISASLDYAADDTMIENCLNILQQILNIKECQAVTAERLLITVVSILREAHKKSVGSCQICVKDFMGQAVVKQVKVSAVNLLPNAFQTMSFLLKSCDKSIWRENILAEVYPLVIACIREANQDETNIFEKGVECLRHFVEKCADRLQSFYDSSANLNGIQMAFNICNDLLNPQVPELCSPYIGRLVVVLILKGNLNQDNIQLLLRSALVRLNTSKNLILNQSLIVVFAHMIYFEMTPILVFLNTFPSPDGSCSALEFMLDRWLSSQTGFYGYENKATLLALCRIFQLAIMGETPESESINLNRIEVSTEDDPLGSSRYATRSKTETRKVPCTVKILKLLVNEYVHICEKKQTSNEEISGIHQEDLGSDSDQDESQQEGGDTSKFCDFYDEEDYEDEDEDVLSEEIGAIDLHDVLVKVLHDFRHQCRFGSDFMPHLTEDEQIILKTV